MLINFYLEEENGVSPNNFKIVYTNSLFTTETFCWSFVVWGF